MNDSYIRNYRSIRLSDALTWIFTLSTIVALVVVGAIESTDDGTPATTTTTTAVVLTTAPATTVYVPPTTTSTTTTTIQPMPTVASLCPQHYAAALQAGWTDAEWRTLDRIIHRESRCIPTVHNDSYLDGGRDDSYGLTQINLLYHDYWVLPQMNEDPTQLFDPYTNLEIAHQLYQYIEDHGGCGWSPWRVTCD